MNKRGFHFFLSIFSLLMFMAGMVPSVSAQETTADLSLTKTADRTNVRIGENITFTITVTNLGPDAAADISFGDPVPDPLNFVSASCDTGLTPTYDAICQVTSLAVGESATITLVATPITNPAKSERKFTNTAFIGSSATFDPNPDNNTASLHLHIVGKTH